MQPDRGLSPDREARERFERLRQAQARPCRSPGRRCSASPGHGPARA